MPEFLLNEESIKVKFVRPELLTHPQIPGALAGVNPRTIMGQEWWDDMRKGAYEQNNWHCWACGGYSGDDLYEPWLEAHECYELDYQNRTMTFKEVVALCHSCHCFIHSGRMWAMHTEGRIPEEKLEHILDRGMKILEDAGLKPFIYTKVVQYMLRGWNQAKALWMARFLNKLKVPPSGNPLKVWKLIFEGRAYHTVRSSKEWKGKEDP
jgi:hypothetical protein